MDRRVHERLSLQMEARVVNLSCQDRTVNGRIVDASQAGVSIILPQSMEVTDLLRVEFADGTLFGQVMHVTPEGGEYRTGVEIFNVLLGTSDLARLLERTLALGNAKPPVRMS